MALRIIVFAAVASPPFRASIGAAMAADRNGGGRAERRGASEADERALHGGNGRQSEDAAPTDGHGTGDAKCQKGARPDNGRTVAVRSRD